MRFVNRKSTPEDNEEFNIPQVWARYHPHIKRDDTSALSRSITVSDTDKIVLLRVMQGYGEHGNRIVFVLILGGSQVEIQLDLSTASSSQLSERPFRRVWSLAYLGVPFESSLAREQVVDVLKEALSVYGYRGADMQVPDTMVTFQF